MYSPFVVDLDTTFVDDLDPTFVVDLDPTLQYKDDMNESDGEEHDVYMEKIKNTNHDSESSTGL